MKEGAWRRERYAYSTKIRKTLEGIGRGGHAAGRTLQTKVAVEGAASVGSKRRI